MSSVKVPKDEIALLEFVGFVFDTGIILEDKPKTGLRASLHKINRYFYETKLYRVCYVMRYYRLDTFQVDITVQHERSSAQCSKEN